MEWTLTGLAVMIAGVVLGMSANEITKYRHTERYARIGAVGLVFAGLGLMVVGVWVAF
jgi:hypothetical protein